MNRRFALIGHPLGHSLSPLLHGRLFALSGRQDDYSLLDLDPACFSDSGLRRRLEELSGFNITIPYKTGIIDLLDELDPDAAFYGAVNTVANHDGRLVGYNTDVAGFCLALQQQNLLDTLEGKVCVMGIGGAGRTMALEAGRRGARVCLAVRPSSLERATVLAQEMAAQGMTAQVQNVAELQGGWDLLINASPCGMFPHMDEMAPPAAALEGTNTVFDAVYNPADTLLLRTAKQYGCRCVEGMAMLAWQGAEAHRIWDGDRYTSAQMDNLIQTLYDALKNGSDEKSDKEEGHP
ncbi:MAG: shikimate dehydrogenase [Oscillospiraceae bacterium]|nr:shikimate dehydrogenase [Oscillospiraceae bacterium]